MTLPPLPCFSICRPAARAISHDWVTLASITSRKSSAFCSTILDTLFWPEATTRMSTLLNRSTAALTMVAQFSSEFGRLATTWTLPPPSASHSAAIFFRPGALLAQITTLAPAPARTFAANAPNAPVAPVTTAVLPLTLNSDSGSFRKSSDIGTPDSRRRRGDRDEDGADLVAAVDDLAAFVRPDIAAVVLAQHRLLAADDDGQFAGKNVIDLLGRRGVGTGAATGQEMRHSGDERLGAACLGAEQTQSGAGAVVRRDIFLRFGQFLRDHLNFAPFSIR